MWIHAFFFVQHLSSFIFRYSFIDFSPQIHVKKKFIFILFLSIFTHFLHYHPNQSHSFIDSIFFSLIPGFLLFSLFGPWNSSIFYPNCYKRCWIKSPRINEIRSNRKRQCQAHRPISNWLFLIYFSPSCLISLTQSTSVLSISLSLLLSFGYLYHTF